MRRVTPPDAAELLLYALRENVRACGAEAVCELQESRGWASITFTGARHRFRLRIEGPEPEASADAFLAGLADREFDLPGHLVADIALLSDERVDGVGPRLTLEALTVEEA